MAIMRTERLTYGVEDIAACVKFFSDAGFELLESKDDYALFRSAENQKLVFKPANDPGLKPAVEAGSTLRELGWGVDSEEGISEIEARLGNKGFRDEDGMLRAIDPNGLCIGFYVTEKIEAQTRQRPSNQNRNIERVNERLESYGAPRPLRIVHVAYNITKAANEEALKFYTELLKFKPVDKVLDTGTFLQSEGDIEHHNFFLCFRPDKGGINHIALEVKDFDEVMEGGNHMITQGWKESRRAGRHRLGSNVYRFIHCPAGGRIEYVADMDRMDKSWETRVFEKNPGHHLWTLKSSGPEMAEQD